MLLAVAVLAGCQRESGTQPQTQADRLRRTLSDRERTAATPPHELRDLAVRPTDTRERRLFYKPGHWFSATVAGQSNLADFRGRLVTDRYGLLDMPFSVAFDQPIELAQGEEKISEMLLFLPPREWAMHTMAGRPMRPLTLRLARGDSAAAQASVPLEPLDREQFFFVVLAEEPARYQYLEQTPSFVETRDIGYGGQPDTSYHLVLPRPEGDVDLPSSALGWTATAYLLWDRVDPDRLSSEQRRAIVDWLSWGGQLVVSGPETLNRLRTSFLAEYLPAASSGTRLFTADDLGPLAGGGWIPLPAVDTLAQPLDGERLAPTEGASVLIALENGDPWVVAKPMGRGRVVATAFRLDDPVLQVWLATEDSLLNSAILGRPPRRWVADPTTMIVSSKFQRLAGGWGWPIEETQQFMSSPRTRVQLLSRDLGRYANLPKHLASDADAYTQPTPTFYRYQAGYESHTPTTDPTIWDDYNLPGRAARGSLEVLGLAVPERQYVLGVLGLYLLILVPANWLFFRLWGRPEWAWLAAPLITVAYTGVVIYLTGVSLGFSRHRNEVAMLELQPGYERGHLTRYTSLYASLASNFEVTYSDPSTVVLPFSKARPSLMTDFERALTVTRQVDGVRLQGLSVASNSEERLHSEELFTAEGPLRLEAVLTADGDLERPTAWRLTNETGLLLQEVEIVTPAGIVAVGDLESGSTIQVPARTVASITPLKATEAAEGEELSERDENRNRILPLWTELRSSPPTEHVRVLGWTDQPLGGVSVSPPVAVTHQATMVVMEVNLAPLPNPEPDPEARAVAVKIIRDHQQNLPDDLDLDLDGEFDTDQDPE